MGGKSSKEEEEFDRRSIPASSSSSYSTGGYSHPYPAYDHQQQEQLPPPYVDHPTTTYTDQGSTTSYSQTNYQYENQDYTDNPSQRTLQRYSRIDDNYSSLDQVTEALSEAGLESSNLIVGIDFTKSNEWTGKHSFHHRSLHHIGDIKNPYEQAISILGKTLSPFDEDNLIPCFGFGDVLTHDKDVFSFYSDGRSCNGFEEVLSRYREIVPDLQLAGPTSFAPIIEMAITIVEQSGGQYHVLLIVADGQVTRSIDTGPGQLSSQEKRTVDAIVQASRYPLSIVLVGVGDGPWDTMKEFDDNIPTRSFDNFQFVNFTEIMSKNVPQSKKEMEFAVKALMEIPLQYKATLELSLLGRTVGNSPGRIPLPPPGGVHSRPAYNTSTSEFPSFQKKSAPPLPAYDISSPTTGSPVGGSSNIQVCPVCLTSAKDMAFGCGHQTCKDCGEMLENCPICRSFIQTRIRLY